LGCIDPSRVGLTGYSFGGIISIGSVEVSLASKLGNGFVYKATLPVYPSCQASLENTKSTKTKVHILAGSADDYSPAKYCVEGVKAKQAKGWDIQITLLDGAHHGFNNDYPLKKNPKSWTFGDCGNLSIDADGYEVSKKHNGSTRSDRGTFVKTMAKKCGRRGVTVGGSGAFAAKTMDFTVKYFKEHL